MARIYDVGQYITELVPNVDKIKLFKLCFFAQGWNLAWTGRPLFEEPILAWKYGPVSAELRKRCDAKPQDNRVTQILGGETSNLTESEHRKIESVVNFYKEKRSWHLSKISHGKAWTEARRGLPGDAKSQEELSLTTVREEFTELLHSSKDVPHVASADSVSESISFEAALVAANEIEEAWQGSLSLLADR